jgi:hypothetical protein
MISYLLKLKTIHMPRYVIERELPGAGKLSQADLQAISEKSCNVIRELGPKIQWVESFVTEDKIYCIYNAPDKDILKQHAEMGGFPANRIEEIKNVINPVTAEKMAEAV